MQQLGSYQAVDGVARDTSKDRLLLRRCRDKLTAHIERRTGIKLEPGDVRLVMKQSDAYTWTYTKEVAHLFSRELEDHEPEAYQKLCREVGRSFHAITFSKGDFAGGHLRSGKPTAIRHTNIRCGFSMMETSAAYDAITRMQLQENIWTLEQENERLMQETQKQREDATYHRDFFYKLLEAIDQLNATVSDIRQDYIRTVNISMFPKDQAQLF
ncbi:uncharacterized protein FPOAC1_013278 [Fusarium poae]|uniref:uncharacterized protein n=1 Tax=Fusarium poae TaxID=36050 RepID=UPI001D038236|nr:uncharacterized protein FPOAC1_013278 [Fusarium poae]KAG8665299.1 hypothetical protein FPOAC1_013278 [Fusarium poae]